MTTDVRRRATAEAIGTAMLLAAIVGSGIMADTFGLLAVIWGCSRRRSDVVSFAVAAYIAAAYWFTASTSFANPAVTLARSLTDTFAGIRPTDVPGFVVVQCAGAIAATALFRWLVPIRQQSALQSVPRDTEPSMT
jgi:glycerol uptake facilitator-like aquaporin